jgi:hypothetical protein
MTEESAKKLVARAREVIGREAAAVNILSEQIDESWSRLLA